MSCYTSECQEGSRSRQAEANGRPTAAFKAVARANRWKLTGPKRGFLVQGDDRIGAVADLIGKLAGANINVIAVDAVSVDGRYGALCWAPRDVKKAAVLCGVVVRVPPSRDAFGATFSLCAGHGS